jgi:hypothetical protein
LVLFSWIGSPQAEPDYRANFLLQSLVRSSTESVLNTIQEFNDHFHNFGKEHPQNFKRNEAIFLEYKMILLQDIRYPGEFCSDRAWQRSVDKFHLSCFEELRRIRPKLLWALIDVSGDGNCFFHSGAANQVLNERTQTRHHFYYQLRDLLCNILRDMIDDGPADQTGGNDFLHYYQMQCTAAVVDDDEQPHEDIHLDCSAASGLSESELAERKVIVRDRILEDIEKGREHGSFNKEQHILAFAILTSTKVKVLSYEQGSEVRERDEFTPDRCTDPSKFIVMIHDRSGGVGAEHWITAVSLDLVNGYVAPVDPPKTTKTHDEKGSPRTADNPCLTRIRRKAATTANSKRKRATDKSLVVLLPPLKKKRILSDISGGVEEEKEEEVRRSGIEWNEQNVVKRHIWASDRI